MKKKAFNQLLFLFIFLLTNYNIANAMKKNTKKTAYQCNRCDEKYYSQNDIYKHIQQHTIDQLIPISLQFVPEKLEPSQQHTGERSYKCHLCTSMRIFSSKSSLTVHIKTHTGEKPYACTMCDKRFTQKTNLTVHTQQYHKEKRPYQCNKCNQKCYNENDIYEHIRQHTIDQLIQHYQTVQPKPINTQFVPEKLEPLFNNGRVLKISYNHPINDEHFLKWIDNI